MKKLFILFFFILFFTTGCYDYTELNELAIVSGISIDYIEDKFHVTFEILNTKNKDENLEKEKVYFASGDGKTITDAFYSVSESIAKTPYTAHLKAVIIDENIAKNHVEDIVDFLLRDNYIHNIFYLVLAKDISAEEIIKNDDINNPVVSTAIKNIIESTYYENNIASTLNFEKFLTNIIDDTKDTYLSTITVKDSIIKLGPLATFNGYRMVDYLSEDESATFNIINGTSKEDYFKINCPNDNNKYLIVSTYGSPKSKIEIDNNNVTINVNIETRITENQCELDFKDKNTYTELQNELEKDLQNKIKKLNDKLLKDHTDILQVEHLYYKKYKKNINFTKLNYDYKTTALINRNGLIFEVTK